jgi:TonB family protein
MERQMKKALLTALAILFISPSIYAQIPSAPPPPPKPVGGIKGTPVPSWKEFTSEKGNFAILFLGAPAESVQTAETEVGRVPITMLTAGEPPQIFMVMFSEYPITFDTPTAAKVVLDNARDFAIKARGGTLLSEKEITFIRYPGRESLVQLSLGVMKSRTFVVKNRIYMTAAMIINGKAKDLEDASINGFFDSFKFIKSPEELPSSATGLNDIVSAMSKLPPPPPEFYTRPANWQELSLPEFGFKAQVPNPPYKQTLSLNPSDSRLNFQLMMMRGDDLLCQIVYQPLLAKPRDEAQAQVTLGNLRTWLTSNAGTEILSETQIKLDRYPGREYKLRFQSWNGVGRAYLADNRVYLLISLPVGPLAKAADVSRFLDSFTLTPIAETSPTVGTIVDSTPWREYTDADRGFAVLLPGKPQTKEPGPYNSVDITSVQGNGVTCFVTMQSAPDAPAKVSGEDRYLRDFKEGIAKAMKFTATDETPIKLDSHRGIEFKVKGSGLSGVSRVYLVKRKGMTPSLYTLLVFSINPDSAGMEKFLNSFKLIEISPLPPANPLVSKRGRPPEIVAVKLSSAEQGGVAPPKKINVSGGVLQANAIKKVQPPYPPEAKFGRVQGVVKVQVLISEDGNVIDATIISGPEELREVSVNAAKQWLFKPTELSGVPVRVQGVLTFNFALQ